MTRCYSIPLLTVYVVSHLFSLLYVSCLDIQKSDCIIWFHYMNHLFSHQYLQYLITLLRRILSTIRLHKKDKI